MFTADIGNFFLAVAWLLSIAGVLFGAAGGKANRYDWFRAARSASIVGFISQVGAMIALAYLFLSGDYSVQYVWQFSDRNMPTIYKVTAIWGGMDGSMLLWCFFLGIAVLLVAIGSLKHSAKLMSWVLSVLNSSLFFFLTITFFFTNPFRYIETSFIPPDGNGLNPLLQNPYMAIHPPMLYLGFTFLTVPYAFCLAALFSGRITNEWLRLTRSWTLIAWAFLTVGITLGGYWAYIELGWGGFWAWDPVENASLLPWLTATAFLHSVMVQERKGMLKMWNVWLVVISYLLTVFGTFLTRSGIVESVHAFASTDIGWVFLLYIGAALFVTTVLVFYRRKELRSERNLESFVSREAVFLLNNLVFLSVAFATLWGVMFPVISEFFTGTKQAVGVPFFNAVNGPLLIFLLFLMGVGPLIAWRKATITNLKRSFLFPAIIALVSGVLLLMVGITSTKAVTVYALSVFVTLTVLSEIYRGAKSKAAKRNLLSGAGQLLQKHRSRYGGHLVHIGVVLASIGITASLFHKVEREFVLAPQERYSIGRYVLELQSLGETQQKNYEALHANLLVSIVGKDNATKSEMYKPEIRVYRRNQETTSEVVIRKSFFEDLYLVLSGFEPDTGKASFKVYVNPLQSVLWIGVLVMVIGTLIVIVTPRNKLIQTSSTSLKPVTV